MNPMFLGTVVALLVAHAQPQSDVVVKQINPGIPQIAGPTAPGSAMTETLTVEASLPTVSPAFGNVLALSGEDLIVSGACIPRRPGSDGQIATFIPQTDGTWKCEPFMPQVSSLRPEDFVLQRLACSANTLVTPIVRKVGSSELVWFERVNDRETWKQRGLIKAPSGATRVNFGGAIAMSGDLLAVSEINARPNLKDEDYLVSPKVYLFRRTPDGWQAEGAVSRDAAKKPYWFGASIALDGDTLAVGYPTALQPFQSTKAHASLDSPMVCIYRRGADGWKLEQDIAGTPYSRFFGFGNSIAIEGDLMAVQSLNPFAEGANVFVFRRHEGIWSIEAEIIPGVDVVRGRGFGFELEVSGGRVIVGDGSAVQGEDKSGRVFVFEKSGTQWVETHRLQPKALSSPRSFGTAVAAKWPWIVVGRVRNENLGIEPGGAYLFDMRKAPPPPVQSVSQSTADPAAPAVTSSGGY